MVWAVYNIKNLWPLCLEKVYERRKEWERREFWGTIGRFKAAPLWHKVKFQNKGELTKSQRTDDCESFLRNKEGWRDSTEWESSWSSKGEQGTQARCLGQGEYNLILKVSQEATGRRPSGPPHQATHSSDRASNPLWIFGEIRPLPVWLANIQKEVSLSLYKPWRTAAEHSLKMEFFFEDWIIYSIFLVLCSLAA